MKTRAVPTDGSIYFLEHSPSHWFILLIIVIGSVSFLFIDWAYALMIVPCLVIFMTAPLYVRSYISVENGRLIKYSSGGKNTAAELTLSIQQITQIQITGGRGSIDCIELFTNTNVKHKWRVKEAKKLAQEIMYHNDSITYVEDV